MTKKIMFMILVVGPSLLFGSMPVFIVPTLYEAWRLETSGVRTQGTVVGKVKTFSSGPTGKGSTTTYRPLVEFDSADGRTLRFAGSGRVHDFPVGRTVTVVYLPDRPAVAGIDDFSTRWMGPAISTAISVPVGLMIVWAWVRYFRKLWLDAWLRRHGRRILAEIDYVGREIPPRRKKKSASGSWRITARWTDSMINREHVFGKGGLAGDPAPYITMRQVAVFIDPSDPERHTMDLSFLPWAIR